MKVELKQLPVMMYPDGKLEEAKLSHHVPEVVLQLDKHEATFLFRLMTQHIVGDIGISHRTYRLLLPLMEQMHKDEQDNCPFVIPKQHERPLHVERVIEGSKLLLSTEY